MKKARLMIFPWLMTLGVLLLAACNADMPYAPTSTDPVVRGGAPAGINRDTMLDEFTGAGDRSGGGTESQSCVGSSAVLLPDTTLSVYASNSELKYSKLAVAAPTLVSLSICPQDTQGTTLRPRAAVVGPNQNLVLLKGAHVYLNLVDIGLTPGNPANANYKIYRYDEPTRTWSFHEAPVIISTTVRVTTKITRHGRYAFALTLPVVPDSSWSVSGIVTPGGGVLSLRNSSLAVSPGALTQSTLISFTVRTEVPAGLPGALPRVYEFGPEGTKFLTPAILSVSFDDAGMSESLDPTRNEVMKHFYYHDEANNRWIIQETQIDVVNRRFLVRLDHFSRYAFGR